MDALVRGYVRVVVDLGTGDGRTVLRRARKSPDMLVVGVDASADALQDASRKAPPNALFLVADAIEALRTFEGHVDELRITLPWGSLLRRVLEGERDFALAVAGSL